MKDNLRSIAIRPPDIAAVQVATVAPDVAKSRDHWLTLAQQNDKSIIYFSVYLIDPVQQENERLVGQILLHDVDRTRQEALVAYHLFQPQDRGHGIGTSALLLLLQYVNAETELRRLAIITDQENSASQRVAEKCGFVYAGPAREGLPLICYIWQRQESI